MLFPCDSSFSNGLRSLNVVNIYTRPNLKFSKINVTTFYFKLNLELCNLKLLKPAGSVNILSVYRSPDGDIKTFLHLCEQAIEHVFKCKDQLIVCGDFKINFF